MRKITGPHIQQLALRTSLPKFVKCLKEFSSYCNIKMYLNYITVKLLIWGRGVLRMNVSGFPKHLEPIELSKLSLNFILNAYAHLQITYIHKEF